MKLALEDVTVVEVRDGTLKPHMTMEVEEEGKIHALRTTAPDFGHGEFAGKYLMPGLINAHVHLEWDGSANPRADILGQSNAFVALRARENAMTYLKMGMTTVRDTGGLLEPLLALTRARRMNLILGPRIVGCGASLCMTGGHGHYTGIEVDGPEGVRQWTRRLLKEDVDFIKLMATGGIYTSGEKPGSPQYTFEEMRAGVEEAHKKGKRVAAHAQGTEGIVNALRAGVDTLEHGIFLDDECLDLFHKTGAYLVPTLVAITRIAEGGEGVPTFAVEKARYCTEAHFTSVQKAIDAGVKIVVGTDGGSPNNPASAIFEEMDMLHRAGISNAEVVRGATSLAAEAIDFPLVGAIEEGRWGDFLVLDKNPLEDLSALRTPLAIFQGGRRVL